MPVIFHVPRPSAPEASRNDSSEVLPSPATASPLPESLVQPQNVPAAIAPAEQSSAERSSSAQGSAQYCTGALNPLDSATSRATPAVEPSAPAAKVTSPSSQPKQPTRSNPSALILVLAAAIILVAATFFFTRKHYAHSVAEAPSAGPAVSAPAVSAPAVSAPAVSVPAVSAAPVSVPSVSVPAVSAPQPTQKPSLPAVAASSDIAAGKPAADSQPSDDQPPAESSHNLGTLLVVAGQDDASVFLDGKLQRQLTRAGQVRLPNLELKDYVVQVLKSGFQDPPQQKVRVRKGEQARLVFKLQPQPQPQPRLASLTIQGGSPGTTVLVDQTLVGTIQPDGTLSVSTVNPGDHTVELRNQRFKPRQFKKHFVCGRDYLSGCCGCRVGSPSRRTKNHLHARRR